MTRVRGLLTAIAALIVLAATGALARHPQNELPGPQSDVERIAALTRNSVKFETDRTTIWFALHAVPDRDIKPLVDRIDRGVAALEAFLHTPRQWQEARTRKIEYYFDAGPFFVPHATLNAQVLIPVVRIGDGQAPILHETTHALLIPPQGRRPFAWLSEGIATYVAKTVSAQTGIQEGDIFENGEIQEIDGRCAIRLASPQGPRILPFIGAEENLSALYAMEPAMAVRQTFYGCAASFTKFLVDKLGIDGVVDLLPERDPHKKIEDLSKMKMSALRSAWIAQIGAKLPR